MEAITQRGAVGFPRQETSQSPASSGLAPKQPFSQVMEALRGGSELNLHSEVTRMLEATEAGRSIPFADLIRFQVAAGQFGLRIELLSKTAESAVATARRLQSPQ